MTRTKIKLLKYVTSLLDKIMDNKNGTKRIIAYHEDGITPFREYVYGPNGNLKKAINYYKSGEIQRIEKFENNRSVLVLTYYDANDLIRSIEIREPGKKEVVLEFDKEGNTTYSCLRGKSFSEVLNKKAEGNRW